MCRYGFFTMFTPFFRLEVYKTCTLKYQTCLKTVLWAVLGLQRYAFNRVGLWEKMKRIWVRKTVCCMRATRCLRPLRRSYQYLHGVMTYERWGFCGVECLAQDWCCAWYAGKASICEYWYVFPLIWAIVDKTTGWRGRGAYERWLLQPYADSGNILETLEWFTKVQ